MKPDPKPKTKPKPDAAPPVESDTADDEKEVGARSVAKLNAAEAAAEIED